MLAALVKRGALLAAIVGLWLIAAPSHVAEAASAREIDTKVDLTLENLMEMSQTARSISEDAVATLVFPDIVKAGFGVGGQYGEGALRRDGETVGYYNIVGGSFGFQIGAQSYANVMFFMTEEALDRLQQAEGFEIGADANVAVANQGVGFDINSSTVQEPIVAFVFGQKGLMAGVTIEGSKITEVQK